MKLTTASTSAAPAARGDAALLSRAKTGDNQALAEFYESTYNDVWHTVRALVKNEDDAMDVLQDTYLKAFSKLNTVEKPESLRPWLRQIAANTAKNHLVRKRPTLFSELEKDDDSPVDFADDRTASMPESALDQKETARLVNEMLDSLSDVQRMVIGMYYYQEMPVKDIAQQMGVSQNTVKSQLRYGRQKIEQRVKLLEKQGVKLCGLAPMAFFQSLLKRSLDGSAAPKAATRITGALSTKGVEALEVSGAVPVKAVTAGTHLARKLVVGAAALAAAAGIALGVGLLVKHSRANRKPAPEQPSDQVLASETQAQTEPAVETELPTAPETEPATEPAPAVVYEPWQEAFLNLLAGSAQSADENSKSWIDTFPDLLQDASIPNGVEWYLADCDGDGTLELIRGAARGNNADYTLVYSLDGDAVKAEYRFFRYGSQDVRSTMLNTEDGSICYNAGTVELSVENPFEEEDGPWYFLNSVTEGTGAPYEDLPDYGPLSVREAAAYPADYETYKYYVPEGDTENSVFLEHLTLRETGDEYFLASRHWGEEQEPIRFIREDEYRALEQELIGKAVWRCPDETQAPQLQDIPGEDCVGPMDARTLVEQLGGIGDGEEWSRVREFLVPYGTRILELLAREAELTAALQAAFPNAQLEGCVWEYAVVFSNDLPSADLSLLLCCRPGEGAEGPCYIGKLQYQDGLEPEQITFFPLEGGTTEDLRNLFDSLYLYLPADPVTGEAASLRTVPEGLDYELWTGNEFFPILFRSADQLTARFTADPMSLERDLGEPTTAAELLGDYSVDN